MAGLEGTISAILQAELEEILHTAKRKHLDSIRALESRITSEVTAYRDDIAKLRQERDEAVEAHMNAQLTAQKAAQDHALERHEWQSQLSQARHTADSYAKEIQRLRKQAGQIIGALEKLADSDKKLHAFMKWSYDMAETGGPASYLEEDDDAPHGPIPASLLKANVAPVGTLHISTGISPPAPRSLLHDLTASSSAAKSTHLLQSTRLPPTCGMPTPKARTVTAVFELEVKKEEPVAPPVPAQGEHERRTHPPTPREKHESTTLQTNSKRRTQAHADEESSEDEMMLRPAAVTSIPTYLPTSAHCRVNPVGAPGDRCVSTHAHARVHNHLLSQQRRGEAEYESKEGDEGVDAAPGPSGSFCQDRRRERVRGRVHERSASPKRRKIAGTPLQKMHRK